MARPLHDIRHVAAQFTCAGTLTDVAPWGSGHINDTYVATYSSGGAVRRFIHQRINHDIFRDPVSMMENIARVTEHLQRKLEGEADAEGEALALVPTRDGANHYVDRAGNYWRTYRMIEGARSYDTVQTELARFIMTVEPFIW